MSEYIEVGQPLQFTDPNTPTRAGEIVESVSDIYNIPSPRLGMQVFVRSEKKSFVITSLKSKVVNGVDVPEAAVEAFEAVGAKSITWNNDTDPSNMNDFVVAWVYDIKGEHTREDDNLPILNTGGGHSFNARLTVLDSSIPGNGKDDDKCITQVLSFSNRLGQGEVYIRTGKGSSLDNLIWENWSTLQRNVYVDEVTSLDHLVDNGIYSGAYIGTGNKFTFVMVVINDYALAAKLGADRVVNQFLYAVEVGGVVRYTTRQKIGGAPWGGEEILNKKEIDGLIEAEIKKVNDRISTLIDDNDPNTLDSIKDLVNWVEKHGADAAKIIEDINKNTEAINNEAEARIKDVAEEKTRATEAEQALGKAVADEAKRATEAEKEISQNAIAVDSMGYSTTATDMSLEFETLDGKSSGSVTFPSATTKQAGVMSAADKVKIDAELNIREIAEPTGLDFNTYITQGIYNFHCMAEAINSPVNSYGELKGRLTVLSTSQDNTVITQVVNLNNNIGGEGNIYIRSCQNGEWKAWRKLQTNVEVEQLVGQEITRATEAERMLSDDIDKLKDGTTIVGQAREIHSRNGKTVTDSFLARTTAGSGTIGDGVASLKSVGGNIVKNRVDIDASWDWGSSTHTINNIINVTNTTTYSGIRWTVENVVEGHKYYLGVDVCNVEDVYMTMQSANDQTQYATIEYKGVKTHTRLSTCGTSGSATINIVIRNRIIGGFQVVPNLLFIDLTEMFGETKANQMTKEECDRLFGTMDALQQGLNFANPKEFKSTGYNQSDPNKVLANKGVKNGAIDDKVGSNVAIVPCLPCKIGEGENNGYCIHGAFDEGAERVYLTPLNPLEVDGEIYLCELTKDVDKGTYVPQIKGYMLVEVPNATDLCVHFLWSEDRGRHDFEPYFENKIELPVIPQMSEWGLAGIQSSGTLACDEIDFVKGIYRKKIEKANLAEMLWFLQDGRYYTHSLKNVIKPPFYGGTANAVTESLTIIPAVAGVTYTSMPNELIVFNDGVLFYRNESITSAKELIDFFRDTYLYYELATPEEYPLPKVDNNYISSDYGVEQFDSVVPCNANNLYYMRSLAGETRNFLDRMYANTDKTDANEVANYITTNIADNKARAEEAPNLALRALYVAAGATYNSATGLYSLNGVDDLTESDIAACYNYKNAVYSLNMPRTLVNSKIRTLYPVNHTSLGQIYTGNLAINGLYLFQSSAIELFRLSKYSNIDTTNSSLIPKCSSIYGIFNNCTALHTVYPLDVGEVSPFVDSFANCVSLKTLRLFKLSKDLSLSDSPLIDKESILYIIVNAAPISAITITLHPDAYARLAEDADIVAALEAQPLITLVSA